MRRGDVVTVALSGDYGKPRPAVVIQSDALPPRHSSVVVCPMTSTVGDPADFRVTVEPSPENGLRVRSQIMADKPVTVRRDRIGDRIGTLTTTDTARMNAAIGFVMGLAD